MSGPPALWRRLPLGRTLAAADQAREALNFNLSFLIYAVSIGIAGLLLFLFIVGIFLWLLLIPMALAGLILSIVGAVKANKGEAFRYPLTIRMVS